jgi:hypothetical protein
MKWVDADDLIPDFNVQVLVMVDGDYPHIAISSYQNDNGGFGWVDIKENEYVSHWASTEFPETQLSNDSILNRQRSQELFDHLCKEFDEEYAVFALDSISYSIQEYDYNCDVKSPQHSEYQFYSKLRRDAYDLYRVCQTHTFLDKYKSACWALKNDLGVVSNQILNDLPELKKRGRPSATLLRNKLIRDIYGCYPASEKGHKNEGSHFELTIGMILKWVEYPAPTDIHSVVIRALRTKH